MDQTIDFERIALRIAAHNDLAGGGKICREICEALQLVWNARGAADGLALMETVGTTGSLNIGALQRALTGLDRR